MNTREIAKRISAQCPSWQRARAEVEAEEAENAAKPEPLFPGFKTPPTEGDRIALSMTEIFDTSVVKSPRLKWLENHNVHTHEFVQNTDDMSTYNHLGFGRWIAFVGRTIPPHEDSNRIWSNGETEDEALVNLAKGSGWKLWNEETAATKPLNSK